MKEPLLALLIPKIQLVDVKLRGVFRSNGLLSGFTLNQEESFLNHTTKYLQSSFFLYSRFQIKVYLG